MPVILEPENEAAWLGEQQIDAAALMRPAEDAVLRIWPVSRKVNSVRNDGRELLYRLDVRENTASGEASAGANPA